MAQPAPHPQRDTKHSVSNRSGSLDIASASTVAADLYRTLNMEMKEDIALAEAFAKARPLVLGKSSMREWKTWDKTYVEFTDRLGERVFIKEVHMSDEEFARRCFMPGMASPMSRLCNERRAMEYVLANHSVPVLMPHGDPNCPSEGYLQTDWADGILAEQLELPEDRAEVARELVAYADELAEDTSESIKSFAPEICLPFCVHSQAADIIAFYNTPSPYSAQAFPLCHGDLTTLNVVCYKDRPRVMYVLDWEYAGWYPSWCQPVVGATTGDRSGKGLVPVRPWKLPSSWETEPVLPVQHDTSFPDSASSASS